MKNPQTSMVKSLKINVNEKSKIGKSPEEIFRFSLFLLLFFCCFYYFPPPFKHLFENIELKKLLRSHARLFRDQLQFHRILKKFDVSGKGVYTPTHVLSVTAEIELLNFSH